MEEKKKNINFLKKIGYSLVNINKYDDMIKEGLKRAMKYVFYVSLIFAIIYSLIITLSMYKSSNKLKHYLSENLKNISYAEGKLSSESEESIILDDKLIIYNLKAKVVINTKLTNEELIEQYKENKENTIILSSSNYIVLNYKGEAQVYEYKDVIKQYFGEDVDKLKEQDILYLFDDIQYSNYIIAYTIAYLITMILVAFIYVLVVSLLIFLVVKIIKIKVKYTEVLCSLLYAFTFLLLELFILNFITGTFTIYLRVIAFIIPALYTVSYIYIKQNGFHQKCLKKAKNKIEKSNQHMV